MNELSTIEGLPGWDALPAEERLKVRKLHAACREIAAAPNKVAAYKLAAQVMRDAGHPLSWQSVQRKFLAWQTSGSLLALADLRMAGMRPTRAQVKHPGFIAYWTELQTRCQRNGGQAYPMLLDIWRKKTEVIPGYESWPGHPQIPVGWSKKNLMRIKPAALEAKVMREGIKAAAPLLPMVLTTRVGMEAGEYYVSDDNWVDAHVICGKQIVRPLQLGCLDIATGKMVHWGMMPRMMRQDGTHVGLTERYMRMFVAGLLANVGINTSRGTTLVVENGTAAIRAHMEQVLLDLFDGAVKVHRSGMEGKSQALLRGYEGRQGGNPRGKAHLESVWNLTANIWSSCLPAPSGHDRTEPEWLAGLMKEQKALLKKQGYLEIKDPDRAAMLRHLMPTFEQLTTDIAWRVYDAFNSRTDHALEGWERMGLVVPMVRLSTDSDWITLTDSIPEADRHTLLNMAARDPERLVTSRRLSPAEAWNLKLQHQAPLRKATQWEIVDLLSRDLAVKACVRGSYIIMQNKAVSMDRLYYPASIVTPEGYQRILPSGMDVWVMLNMFDDQHLYIIDEKGRCLGMSTLQQRAPYYDEDQVRAAMGRKKKATAAALQDTRVHNARKEAAILGTRLYNHQIVKGTPTTVKSLLNAEGTDAAAQQAVKDLPGISLLPEAEAPETASPQKESHPKISFL